jgi:hypothetical protein
MFRSRNSVLAGIALSMQVLVGVACHDDSTGPAPADFGQLCGQDQPVRLLPIDPEQPPVQVEGRILVDDRYLFLLRYYEDGSNRFEIWSVGECGEDPQRLADDVLTFLPMAQQPWPDAFLACRAATHEYVALDPTGARPANALSAARNCFGLPVAEGLLTILGDDETGPLVLQPWPDEPFGEVAEAIVLLDEVRAYASPPASPRLDEHAVLAVGDGEVLAVTAADELVRVDLDDLSSEVLATGVREFSLGPSGRWLVWQGAEIIAGSGDGVEGPVYLLDRTSGESKLITETALAYSGVATMVLEPLDLLFLRINGVSQVIHAPTLESFEVPAASVPLLLVGDTRALFANQPLTVIDTTSGEHLILDSGPAVAWSANTEHLTLLRSRGGELVRITYTGESRVLARHAVEGWQVADDTRVFTLFTVNAKGVGPLIVVAPDSLAETFIDEDVLPGSISLIDNDAPLVSYAVLDGERSGIWLAKPAG